MRLTDFVGNSLPLFPSAQQSKEKDDLARAFHYFVWLLIAGVTFLFVALATVYTRDVARWGAIYAGMLLASLLGLWLNRNGNTRRAVIGFLVSLWLVMTLFSFVNASILAPNSNRYVLIVVAAGLLLGRREGMIAAALCGVTEIVFEWYARTGIAASPASQYAELGLLVHLVVLALAALLPALATRSVRNALSSAREELDERRRNEKAELENEGRYNALLDGSPDPIMIHRNGEFVYVNPAALNLLRMNSSAMILGKAITEIVQPESKELMGVATGRGRQGRSMSQIREGKMLRADGTYAEIETLSTPVSFQRRPAIQTVVRDISVRRLLQEQIKLQISALNSAANGIIITDREGTIVWTNAAFQALTGYSAEESLGKNPKDLVNSGKQRPGFYHDMWSTILSGKVWQGELLNRRKDGSLYTERMTITPVLNEDNIITHFIAVKEDVTSRRLLEEQLLQAQKLEGIGQLAGGVAHDYNNILNVVLGYAELMRRKIVTGSPAAQQLDAIVSAAKRGADLTRQLLAFARKEIVSPKVVNINSSIESLRNLLHRVIGENVKLTFVPGKDLWNVKIDPGQFDQILFNLSSNARDAIHDIGSIAIRTVNAIIDSGSPEKSPDLPRGEYVKLEFEDNGTGMDLETMNRIFDPFFSTKPKGHGTGMGLSTIYGIVKQSGGAIRVKSEPGKGSLFEIYLPRFAGEGADVQEPTYDETLRGSETILVVEDQPDLLNLAKITLEDLGYAVMTSLDPIEAVLLSEAYNGEIHLLLTDIVMPNLGGMELSRKLTSARPDMKILFMSGYGSDALPADDVLDHNVEFIQKPFLPRELASKIRRVLTGKFTVS